MSDAKGDSADAAAAAASSSPAKDAAAPAAAAAPPREQLPPGLHPHVVPTERAGALNVYVQVINH